MPEPAFVADNPYSVALPAQLPPPMAPDPILGHPEYLRAFAHYTQHVDRAQAHALAYQQAAQTLASVPPIHPQPGLAQPQQQVIINNRMGGTIGLSTGVHILHLFLTLGTVGIWLPIWILHAFMSRRTIR